MSIDAFAGIKRVPGPSPREFETRYVRNSTPAIFTGLVDEWPALSLWTPQHLKSRCGHRLIPSARTREGMLEHDEKNGVVYEPIELGRFVDSLESPACASRYATFPVDEHVPELASDLGTLPYVRDARWSSKRLWIGPKGTAAPMHRDLAENLYVQIYGRKQMFLIPPEASRRMYPYPWHSSIPNFGRVDAEAPDLRRHPAFEGVCGIRVVLEPGDVLYLPSLWWHQTRSLDASISFNIWWAKALPLVGVLKLAELYKRITGIRN